MGATVSVTTSDRRAQEVETRISYKIRDRTLLCFSREPCRNPPGAAAAMLTKLATLRAGAFAA